MTYPDTSGGENLSKEKLLEILAEVDLQHLCERKGCFGEKEELRRLTEELTELTAPELKARALLSCGTIKSRVLRKLLAGDKTKLVKAIAEAEASVLDYEINCEFAAATLQAWHMRSPSMRTERWHHRGGRA